MSNEKNQDPNALTAEERLQFRKGLTYGLELSKKLQSDLNPFEGTIAAAALVACVAAGSQAENESEQLVRKVNFIAEQALDFLRLGHEDCPPEGVATTQPPAGDRAALPRA